MSESRLIKFSRASGAVFVLQYSAIAASLFTIYHIILNPVFIALDGSTFAPLRGPVFEELFKYGFAYLLLRSHSIHSKALASGLGVGTSETIINTILVFEAMHSDLRASFTELSAIEINAIVFLAILAKLVFNCLGHYLFVLIGMRLSSKSMVVALAISTGIHLLVNWLLLA